jgi:hypothetical protein
MVAAELSPQCRRGAELRMTESEGLAPSPQRANCQTHPGHPLAIAAQQLPIFSFHDGDSLFDEPNRLATDRGCFPRISSNRVGAIKSLGDFAVTRPGKMGIKRAQHQKKSDSQTCGDGPRLGQGAGR